MNGLSNVQGLVNGLIRSFIAMSGKVAWGIDEVNQN